MTRLYRGDASHCWRSSARPFAEAQTVIITRGGSRAVRPGPAENFTGGVRVEMLFEALDPSHASGGSVTFEPGARTAWHSHPRGQILIVTAGTGRVQRWGDPIEEIRAGDVVRIPAGEKHWHGASPQASMTHIAITEHRDGTAVQWMEKVSDEQYNALPSRPRDKHSTSANAGPVPTFESAARLHGAVGTAAAEDRARPCDAHRRRAVRRCVEAARVVATRPQPGDHLGLDRDGQARAACRPLGPGARQRCAAQRGLRPTGAPGDLLRLAERGLGARGLRAGLHRAEGRHGGTARRGPASSSSRLRRGAGQGR